jgi:hypothetical protein
VEPVFTEFIRRLADDLDPSRFSEVWERLEAILRQELKRRNLWNSPPAYLGVYGWASWEGQSPRGSADQGPLAELTAECYSFVFVDRLAALRAQLEVKPNIEGLVLLNVRHFLHERQRAHDPIGFRVFEMLREAVREAIANGELFVLAGDSGVRNETVLGFDPLAEPEPGAPDLGALVARWNDHLLPDPLLARGRQQAEVLARLRAGLRDLERAGVRSFSVRSVIDPLKNDTRARWAALMEEARGEREDPGRPQPGERILLGTATPAAAFEIEESFADLAKRVAEAIEDLSADPRTRRYLSSLWQFLRFQASEESAEAEWEQLSQRRLAQLLDIPRERLPELFVTLRRLVSQCREGKPARSPARKIEREGPEEEKIDRDRLETSGLRRSR